MAIEGMTTTQPPRYEAATGDLTDLQIEPLIPAGKPAALTGKSRCNSRSPEAMLNLGEWDPALRSQNMQFPSDSCRR